MIKGFFLWLLTATLIWIVGNIASFYLLGAKPILALDGTITAAHNFPVTFLASVALAFVGWVLYKIFG